MFMVMKTKRRINEILVLAYLVAVFAKETILPLFLKSQLETIQSVFGILILLAFLVELAFKTKHNFIEFIKSEKLIILFFVFRAFSYISNSCDYTVLRQIAFEAVYLVALCNIELSPDFFRKKAGVLYLGLASIANFIEILERIILNLPVFSGTVQRFFLKISWFKNLDEIYKQSYFYTNPNHFGMYSMFAAIICLIFLKTNSEKQHKKYLYILLVFFVASLIISRSRSCLISFALVILAYILVNRFKLSVRTVIKGTFGILLIGSLAIFTVIITHPDTEDDFTSIEKSINSYSTGRYYIWKNMYYSREPIVLGLGSITREKRVRLEYEEGRGVTEAFEIHEENGTKVRIKKFDKNSNLEDFKGPHNGYLAILSTAGIIAFGILIYYCASKLRKHHWFSQNNYYLIIIALAILNMLESMLITSKNIPLTITLLLLASAKTKENL